MIEKWKPIKGYEGLYEISNLGNVKSLGRTDRFNKKWGCRIMKPTYVGKHYKMVRLCKDGKTKNKKVHRLVAEAFIPNPDGKPQVNHIDGNKDNNIVSNLEWVTNSENQIHARANGLNPIIKNNSMQSIQVNMLLPGEEQIISTFPSICEAARKTNISETSIRNCVHNRQKHAGGYIWRFA